MIKSDLAFLEAVTLSQSFFFDLNLVEVFHHREFFIVNRPVVEASIELVESVLISALCDIHDTGLQD